MDAFSNYGDTGKTSFLILTLISFVLYSYTTLFISSGLLVARLKGKIIRAKSYLTTVPNEHSDANTIVGDKLTGMAMGKQADSDGWPVNDSYHEIVLRTSAQCLPMIKFDKGLRNHKEGKDCVRFIKKSLQGILVLLFNEGQQKTFINQAPLINNAIRSQYRVPTNPVAHMPIPPVPPAGGLSGFAAWMAQQPGFPGATAAPPAGLPAAAGLSGAIPPAAARRNPAQPSWAAISRSAAAAAAAAAPTSRYSSTTQTLQYTAPRSLTTGVPPNAFTVPPASCNLRDDCVLCLDRLRKRQCVALTACNHVFHKGCIDRAFKSKPSCPVCRVNIGSPQGKSPSGTMTVHTSAIRCTGYQEQSILINYNIKGGKQKSYHDNPGSRHGGKVVTAYLPNNADGLSLLKRLKYSFLHGLSFTVGTSVTTGIKDQCTW